MLRGHGRRSAVRRRGRRAGARPADGLLYARAGVRQGRARDGRQSGVREPRARRRGLRSRRSEARVVLHRPLPHGRPLAALRRHRNRHAANRVPRAVAPSGRRRPHTEGVAQMAQSDDNPTAASREVGVDWLEPTGFGTPSDFTALHILEDTPTLHHMIVCTLCSCYPRPIIGNSPEWYRTPNYRRRIVRWPRQVLGEFGLFLPEDVDIRVEDSNSKHRFLVLPVRPEGTEGWTEEQLAEIVTRDCMIGVALPKPGVTTNVERTVHRATEPVTGRSTGK